MAYKQLHCCTFDSFVNGADEVREEVLENDDCDDADGDADADGDPKENFLSIPVDCRSEREDFTMIHVGSKISFK